MCAIRGSVLNEQGTLTEGVRYFDEHIDHCLAMLLLLLAATMAAAVLFCFWKEEKQKIRLWVLISARFHLSLDCISHPRVMKRLYLLS